MDLQKIYNDVIKRGLERNLKSGYYEIHHIIPKCMGGSDELSNLVKLTAREHFLSHWILAKLNPNNKKVQYAFTCMSMRQDFRKLNSRQYEILKKYHSLRMKKWNPSFDKKVIRKIVDSKREIWGGQWNPNWRLSESGRSVLVERMKNNNPNKGGSWNHTAKKLRVYYENGDVKEYDYMKDFSNNNPISYATLKNSLRKGIVAPVIKKLGVIKLEKE